MIWFRERKVLKFVNGVRADLGLSPVLALLPGERASAARCPIASTIKLHLSNDVLVACNGRLVDVWDRFSGEELYTADLNPAALSWISDFDAGRIPEMVV